MFYRLVQAVVSFAVRLFYRVRVSAPEREPEGPVIFVGNHPNGLMDPALVFILTRRRVTFLAKAPLFALPVLGAVLCGLDALPVFRRQDDPGQMNRNEGTFEAATGALVAGRALTLFPEGKSHSEPGLAELKTGAARIAFRAHAGPAIRQAAAVSSAHHSGASTSEARNFTVACTSSSTSRSRTHRRGSWKGST